MPLPQPPDQRAVHKASSGLPNATAQEGCKSLRAGVDQARWAWLARLPCCSLSSSFVLYPRGETDKVVPQKCPELTN